MLAQATSVPDLTLVVIGLSASWVAALAALGGGYLLWRKSRRDDGEEERERERRRLQVEEEVLGTPAHDGYDAVPALSVQIKAVRDNQQETNRLVGNLKGSVDTLTQQMTEVLRRS